MRQKPKLGDSQRERKKKENFPVKGSNLMWSQAHSQNKGLSEYQRRASWLQTGPSPRQRQRGKCANSQSQKTGGNLSPETASSTNLWAGSQLLTKSSWDPGQLTSARRVAAWDQLPKGDTQLTWDGALMAHRGNWAAGTRELNKMHNPPETVHWLGTWSPELPGPGKGTKCMPNLVCAFAEYPRSWTWAWAV